MSMADVHGYNAIYEIGGYLTNLLDHLMEVGTIAKVGTVIGTSVGSDNRHIGRIWYPDQSTQEVLIQPVILDK